MTKQQENAAKVANILYANKVTMKELADFIRTLNSETLDKLLGETLYENNLKARISRILNELGTPASLKGYAYLRYAIERVYNNPDYIYRQRITKELYPQISKEFNTAIICVERSIRHAIEITWNRGNIQIFDKYFGNTVSFKKGKPTNREFIGMLADVLRIQDGK